MSNLAPLGIVSANGGYIAPSITTCGGGTADACGAVAKDLPQCSGFRCTYSDDLTGTSSIAKELASGSTGNRMREPRDVANNGAVMRPAQ